MTIQNIQNTLVFVLSLKGWSVCVCAYSAREWGHPGTQEKYTFVENYIYFNLFQYKSRCGSFVTWICQLFYLYEVW